MARKGWNRLRMAIGIGMYVTTRNATGTSWKLVTGLISHTGFAPLTNDAGATTPNGTPIAAWQAGTALAYSVGIDPNNPATSPDQSHGIGAAGSLGAPTLITTKSERGEHIAGENSQSRSALAKVGTGR
jgi:hypothetical protein